MNILKSEVLNKTDEINSSVVEINKNKDLIEQLTKSEAALKVEIATELAKNEGIYSIPKV